MNAGAFLLRVRLWAARRDPVLAVALVLLAASAVAWLAVLHAGREVEQRYARAGQQARTPVVQAVQAPPETPDDSVMRLYETLAPESSLQQQLGQVFALASRHGLVLQQGEYRRTARPQARAIAYQVNLPVKGSHGAIWAFALDVLRALPHAALDDVAFRREAVKDAQVEARLRMTLFLADGSGSAP